MPDGLDVTALEAWIREFARTIAEHKEELTELDSAIGDADHGSNMHRGMTAALAALDATPPADPAALLKAVAMAMISKVGGTSGPLYGTFFLRMSGAFGDGSPAAFAAAFRAGVDGVVARGKAEREDKTMVDALLPAVEALKGGASLAAGADAAAEGARSTVPLQARKGRASYLGERSIGHEDPGAASTVLVMRALARAAG